MGLIPIIWSTFHLAFMKSTAQDQWHVLWNAQTVQAYLGYVTEGQKNSSTRLHTILPIPVKFEQFLFAFSPVVPYFYLDLFTMGIVKTYYVF